MDAVMEAKQAEQRAKRQREVDGGVGAGAGVGTASAAPGTQAIEQRLQLLEMTTGEAGRIIITTDRKVRDLEGSLYTKITVPVASAYVLEAQKGQREYDEAMAKETGVKNHTLGAVHLWKAGGMLKALYQDLDVTDEDKEKIAAYKEALEHYPKLSDYVNICMVKISHDQKEGIITTYWPRMREIELILLQALRRIKYREHAQAAPRGPGVRKLQEGLEKRGVWPQGKGKGKGKGGYRA